MKEEDLEKQRQKVQKEDLEKQLQDQIGWKLQVALLFQQKKRRGLVCSAKENVLGVKSTLQIAKCYCKSLKNIVEEEGSSKKK